MENFVGVSKSDRFLISSVFEVLQISLDTMDDNAGHNNWFRIEKLSPISGQKSCGNFDKIEDVPEETRRICYKIDMSSPEKQVSGISSSSHGKRKNKCKPGTSKRAKPDKKLLQLFNSSSVLSDTTSEILQTKPALTNTINKKTFRKSVTTFVENRIEKDLIQKMTWRDSPSNCFENDEEKPMSRPEEKIEIFLSPDKHKTSKLINLKTSDQLQNKPENSNQFPHKEMSSTTVQMEESIESTLFNFKQFASKIKRSENTPNKNRFKERHKNANYSQLACHKIKRTKDEDNSIKITKDAPAENRSIDQFPPNIEIDQSIFEATPPKLKGKKCHLRNSCQINCLPIEIETYESPSKECQDLAKIRRSLTPQKSQTFASPVLYSVFSEKSSNSPKLSQEDDEVIAPTPPKHSKKKRFTIYDQPLKAIVQFSQLGTWFPDVKKDNLETKFDYSEHSLSPISIPSCSSKGQLSVKISPTVRKSLSFTEKRSNSKEDDGIQTEEDTNKSCGNKLTSPKLTFKINQVFDCLTNMEEIVFSDWFKPASQIINEPLESSIGSPYKTPVKELNKLAISKYESPKLFQEEINILCSPQSPNLNVPLKNLLEIESNTEEQTTPIKPKEGILHCVTPCKDLPHIQEILSPKLSPRQEIDNNSFSEICYRNTETLPFVVPNKETNRKSWKKLRPGSLLEKAYNITSRIETDFNLFGYELQAGIRQSNGKQISAPLELLEYYQEDNVFFINCKPSSNLNYQTNLTVVASNISKKSLQGKYIILHFPLTVVSSPKLGSTFVLVGNHIHTEEEASCCHQPYKIMYNNCFQSSVRCKQVVRTLQSNVPNSVLDLQVGQSFMPQLLLNLIILHAFSISDNYCLLGLDEENQFCILCFSGDNLDKIKSKKNLTDGTRIVTKGFAIVDTLNTDESIRTLLEFSSGNESHTDNVFILAPVVLNWELKAVKRALEKRKRTTPIETIIEEKNNSKRYKVNAVSLTWKDDKSLFIGDNSLGHKVKVTIVEDHQKKVLDKSLAILDGVIYKNGQFLVDKYTKVISC